MTYRCNWSVCRTGRHGPVSDVLRCSWTDWNAHGSASCHSIRMPAAVGTARNNSTRVGVGVSAQHGHQAPHRRAPGSSGRGVQRSPSSRVFAPGAGATVGYAHVSLVRRRPRNWAVAQSGPHVGQCPRRLRGRSRGVAASKLERSREGGRPVRGPGWRAPVASEVGGGFEPVPVPVWFRSGLPQTSRGLPSLLRTSPK